jgi:hypothetical protein
MQKYIIKASKNLPFILFPVIFLFLGFNLLRILGPLSLRHGDPDYIYLLTGLSMGHLQFDVGHVDNPGTPLQFIVAIVTRVVHFFSGNGTYMRDVFLRPDFYLHKVIVFNQVLIALMTFYMACKLFPLVKNYFLVMLLQFSFLTGWAVFYNISVISPEVLIFIPVTLLVIQLIKYLYSPVEKLSNKDVLKLALICGFGISIKLDYFPLFFLPVFILKGWRQYAFYSGVSFLSFVLFAFTILKKYLFFYRWVTGLILHSGKYGRGEQNFIDIKAFVQNIGRLVDFYPLFYSVILLLIIFTILSKFNSVKSSNQKLSGIIYGVLLTVLFHTALVAKHFGLGYMMPSIYLIPFMLFLIIYNRSLTNIVNYIVSGLFISIIVMSFLKERESVLLWKIPQMAEKIETSNTIREIVGSQPFMIIDQPYNFYFQESPLLFGWFFQGKFKQLYKDELLKIYPDVYVYDGGPKKFFLWGDLFSENEIIQKQPSVYCFVNAKKTDTFYQLYKNIETSTDSVCVYRNEKSDNRLYSLSKKVNVN